MHCAARNRSVGRWDQVHFWTALKRCLGAILHRESVGRSRREISAASP